MAEVKIARTETPHYEVTLMRKLGDEMDRAFGKAAESAVWRPVIEVKRDKDNLLVHAELPGLNKENVKVTVTGDLLEIEGERKFGNDAKAFGNVAKGFGNDAKGFGNDAKGAGYFHSERNYGKFYRAIPLPDGANTGMALAELTNGVLEVRIPIPDIKPPTMEIPVGPVLNTIPKAEVKH